MNYFTFRNLIAVALVLLGSMTAAPAITFVTARGIVQKTASISGTVIHVDQNRRSFTLQWKGRKSVRGQSSYEQTYRVTDKTVYKNGSWATMAKGIVVRITGISDVVDTVEFNPPLSTNG